MLIIAAFCILLAMLAFRAKRPPQVPQSSRLYRIDNRVVGSTLLILAAAFIVIAVTSGKFLF